MKENKEGKWKEDKKEAGKEKKKRMKTEFNIRENLATLTNVVYLL